MRYIHLENLQQKTGGILLNSEDFGRWSRYKLFFPSGKNIKFADDDDVSESAIKNTRISNARTRTNKVTLAYHFCTTSTNISYQLGEAAHMAISGIALRASKGWPCERQWYAPV